MSVSSLRSQDLAGLDPKWRQALLGVSAHGVLIPPNGKLHLVDSGGPDTLIQTAVDTAVEGDVILIAPGEYDEDVTVTTGQLTLVGAGPRDSVRITGVALGTSTAMTLDGVSDVGLYNLNLEGRSGGSGLVLSGQVRRITAAGCKMHGGSQAVLLSAATTEQFADIRIEDCNIANSAIGISALYDAGDPGHRVFVRGCLFSKITTDCIVENGVTHDWNIYDNVFSTDDGVEPTRYLDINTDGTTGVVANNVFGLAAHSTGDLLIDDTVLYVGNYTEEGISTGRPD